MKCPSCGNEGIIQENSGGTTFVCPHCNRHFNLPQKNEKQGIAAILKEIIVSYGVDVLKNQQRTKALLMDLAPQFEKERKLIMAALQEGIAEDMMQVLHAEFKEQQYCMNRCIKHLIDHIWVTESAAQYAVQCIAYAIYKDQPDVHLMVEEQQSEKEQRVLQKGMLFSDEMAFQDLIKNFDILGYKACAANTNLKFVVIPETITCIKNKAFLNCTELRSISLPSTLLQLGSGVFDGCCSLQEILIGNNKRYCVVNGCLIDKEQKSVLRALQDESPTKDIQVGIEVIGSKAFDYHQVQRMKLPKSVQQIQQYAFYHCLQLTDIEVDQQNDHFTSKQGVLMNASCTILIQYPAGKKDSNYIVEDQVECIANEAFSMASHLRNITFTNQLKVIGEKAFQYCERLETLVFPSNVEVIKERAFQYCKALNSVMLSRAIEEIGDYAFYECSEITTISVPRKVTRIGHMAFANCKKLEKIIVQDNIHSIGDGAFLGCSLSLVICTTNNAYVLSYCKSHGIAYTLL